MELKFLRGEMEVCFVTDRKMCGEEKLLRIISEAVSAGLDMIQIREKDLLGRALLTLAEEVVRICRGTDCRVFINGRFDVALASGADGVHLGYDAIPPEAVKKSVGDKLRIGISIHSVEEAREAHEKKADFAFLGTIFKTPSKEGLAAPLGVDPLKEAASQCRIPLYGIGGINEKTMKLLEGSGADGVAMISGIINAPSLEELISMAREIH
jgi:thiamine-phosphate pyrophosphorylase